MNHITIAVRATPKTARLLRALGINMEMHSRSKYFLSPGGQEMAFNSFSEVLEAIEKALSQQKGKLSLSADNGLRPW